ncbi:MAG: hypothetical protein FWD45_00630 [Coriobacteriia bacterium]|nr:hypothetical protein [Coriobacteriia bacterium]
MKRLFSLVLIIALTLSGLTACGGNNSGGGNSGGGGSASGGSGNGSSGSGGSEQAAELIMTTQLITAEDIERLLDVEIITDMGEVDVIHDEVPGGLNDIFSSYYSDEYIFQIFLYQDALLDGRAKDNGGIAALIQTTIDARESNVHNQSIIPAEEIGDGGFLVDQNGNGWWCLEIWRGDYLITMQINYNPPTEHSRNREAEDAWRIERLLEAGELVIGRLDTLID